MIDLHTHTQFSDGALNPAEHIRRAQVNGYTVVAITDHADASSIDIIIPAVRRFMDDNNRYNDTRALCGIELTHVLPEAIAELVLKSRALGADLVNVHGETIVEPVLAGTNMAAIDAGVDILCHPGLITEDEMALAVEKGIYIELTSKRGHCYTNGYVYRLAKKHGARLLFNNDAHSQSDFVSEALATRILLGCGVAESDIPGIFRNSQELADRLLSKYA
ncbi:MAG: histidinol phosphate phosphatase domain-containing protein [Fibrobacterota bacterium]